MEQEAWDTVSRLGTLLRLCTMESSRAKTVQVKQFQGGGQSLDNKKAPSECWVG